MPSRRLILILVADWNGIGCFDGSTSVARSRSARGSNHHISIPRCSRGRNMGAKKSISQVSHPSFGLYGVLNDSQQGTDRHELRRSRAGGEMDFEGKEDLRDSAWNGEFWRALLWLKFLGVLLHCISRIMRIVAENAGFPSPQISRIFRMTAHDAAYDNPLDPDKIRPAFPSLSDDYIVRRNRRIPTMRPLTLHTSWQTLQVARSVSVQSSHRSRAVSRLLAKSDRFLYLRVRPLLAGQCTAGSVVSVVCKCRSSCSDRSRFRRSIHRSCFAGIHHFRLEFDSALAQSIPRAGGRDRGWRRDCDYAGARDECRSMVSYAR